MNKLAKGQKGIAVLEMVLIVIIVLGLGGIGWFVINSSHKTKDKLDNAAQTSNATVTKTKTSANPPAPADNKFIFKEIGVEMTLPADLKDLSYTAKQLDSATGTGKDTVLYLTMPKMSTDAEKCYGQPVDASSAPSFYAISKIAGQFSSSSENQSSLLKQFSDFYISGSSPNGITDCTESGVDAQLLQNTATGFATSFTSAFKTSASLVQ